MASVFTRARICDKMSLQASSMPGRWTSRSRNVRKQRQEPHWHDIDRRSSSAATWRVCQAIPSWRALPGVRSRALQGHIKRATPISEPRRGTSAREGVYTVRCRSPAPQPPDTTDSNAPCSVELNGHGLARCRSIVVRSKIIRVLVQRTCTHAAHLTEPRASWSRPHWHMEAHIEE